MGAGLLVNYSILKITIPAFSFNLFRLADGGAEARLGNSSVLSTVCRGRIMSPGFLPLTVDYRQVAFL